MDLECKSLLKSLGIPQSVCLLLEMYGLCSLEDLLSLDRGMVAEIEECVGNGAFDAMMDLNSKAERFKYLGYDCNTG